MTSPDPFAAFLDALPLAGRALRACLRRRFREYRLDLTLEMTQVLHYLWQHDGASQQQITCAANFVRRDLVERRAYSHDRRTNRVLSILKGPTAGTASQAPYAGAICGGWTRPDPQPTAHWPGRAHKKYAKSYAG